MPSIAVRSEGSTSSKSTPSSSQTMTVLRETTAEAKSTSSRTFGSAMDQSFNSITTIDEFLDFIAGERLRIMPHRGSKLDRVLAYGAFFASQVQLFSKSTGDFISHSGEASRVIWTNLHLLITNGHVEVLERLFVVYYNLGLTLSSLHAYHAYFTSSTEIQQHLSVFFSNVVRLVVGLASQFGQASSSSATVISSELYSAYGGLIESTYARRDLILNLMFAASIKSEAGSNAYTLDIETIRTFLSPSDRIVRSLTSSAVGSKGFRAEHTCEWMQTHLMEFIRSKQNIFIIQGKPGTGKSYLSGWITERLQRSEGRTAHHDILSFSVERDVCTQTSLTAVAKGLLLQLLDRNVGNIAFYRILCDVFEHAAKAKTADEIESGLWRAIDAGLHSVPQTMIVIDGLDQLDGGEQSALKLLDRIHQVSSKHTHIKSITLGQPLSKAAPAQSKSLTIEPSMTTRDIQSQVQDALVAAPEFRNLKADDKERIVQRLSTTAEGSFLWVENALTLLRREKTVPGMLQTLETLPKTLSESWKRLQGLIDLKATDTRSLLAWLLASQRPLTLDEIKVFFEIDLATCQHKPRFSDVKQDVIQAIGPFVTITSGTVRFKHDTIRTYFIDKASSVKDFSNTGDFPFMVKEAHYDLSTRCLAYVKLFVARRVDPTFDRLQPNVLGDIFESFPALEYASTYWMSHFYQSPMFDPNGKHKLVPEFKNCYPDSTLLAQIEGSVWPTYSVEWYELALTIRQSMLGQQTMPVLQTVINCARIFELTVNYTKASTYYYQAYTLTTQLLGQDADVLIKIATAYLTCSSTTTITEKTEIATQRETMLKRVIQVYKTDRGASHSITIKYIHMLAQLYSDTKQYDSAVTVWTELYEIYVQKYGEFHSETSAIYKTLETTISKSTSKTDITKLTNKRHETTQRDLAVTDNRRTTSESDMYKYYVDQKDYAKAESVIVDQWRSVSEASSDSKDTSLLKRKFDVTIQYVQFLKSQNRKDEARSILQGVYSEYQSQDIRSQSVATSIQSFAEEMKSLEMYKTARSVFSSLVTFFQKSGQSTSSQASAVSKQLEETTEQIVQQSTTTTTTSSAATDESTLTEVFDSLTTTSSSTSSARYTSIIKSAQQLSVYYFRQQQFNESYKVCSQALAIMWPYFITRQGTVRLPSEYYHACVELALRMGECTWAQRQIDNTEDLYTTVFKATKSTLKVTDELYQLTAQTLTDFYDQTYQWRKFLAISKELYEDQKATLGANNAITIRTAYRIATYCTKQNKYKEAEPYYLDVYTVLVKGDDVPVDAIPAVETLLTIYYDDGRWESAEKLCKSVWATFTKRGAEARFSTDLVEKTYDSYSYVLRSVRKASSQEIYQLAKTYRETCQKVFGERNELTLKATLEFASICEQSEEHRKESLVVYEEAIKHSQSVKGTATSTTTTSRLMQTVVMARKSLARMYTQQATPSETASKFVTDEYEQSRSAYGATDERSLSSLNQLVEYNAKQNKTELTQQSVRLLQTAVVDTIVKEKSSEALIQSASSLAESYKKLSQTDTAWELLREMRRQVITGDYTKSSKFNFSLEGTDRRSYTFIIAFGQVLRGLSATGKFSELMADLMTETLLYQAYYKAVSDKAKFDVIFDHGLRLAVFYQNKQRGEDYNRIWTELFELFAANMSASKQSATLKAFFDLVVKEVFEGNFDARIPTITAGRVYDAMKASKFQEAYEYAVYLDKYTHLQGGWRSQDKVEAGFQVCLHLMGRSDTSKVTDSKLYASVVEISRAILSEVLRAARDLNIRFIQMPMNQINDIVALLGEQANYTDLEWLLTELWHSRHSQTSWGSTTIVWIGRRLVEVRFATGRRDAAIHLCEDIAYNVRRVWGAADPVVVQMFDLLASLYTASGEHSKALSVHEDVLRQTLTSFDEDGEIESSQGAEIAKQQLELMRRSYQRNGGWGDKDVAAYKELYGQLHSSFGSEKSFASVPGIEKWNAKDKADSTGVWTKPASFEFVNASDLKHKNNLRKTSGLVTSYTYKNGSSTNGSS